MGQRTGRCAAVFRPGYPVILTPKNIATAVAAAVLMAGVVIPSAASAQQGSAQQQATAQQVDPSAMLLPNLRGLRFVSTVSAVQKDGNVAGGVTVDGPYMLYRPGIYEKLQGFLNHPFREGDMQRITAMVSDWYRKNNRPFVDVAFPEQDISKGVVQVVVTEFHLGEIKVSGNDWFSSSVLRSEMRFKTGDPIDAAKLTNDINWLNENDFRDVTVVAQKSDTPGDTDLVIQADDRFPFRFSAAYANNGAPASGRDRWTIGLAWGNAFWLDQQLYYQYTSSEDFWLHPKRVPVKKGDANFGAHAASYVIPFPWHDKLVLSGTYAQVNPELGPDFGEVGVSWSASARYVIPILLRNLPAQELQFGFDFKRSNNDLQFGGVDISNVTTDIDQFTVNYTTVLSDSLGQTKLTDRLELSPGGMSPGNKDELFQPSTTHNGTPYAKAQYVYNDASVYRLTPLPADFGAVTRLDLQFTSANLLPSEKLEAGGIETVRGYDEYTISGSQGLLFTQEFRTPAFGPLNLLVSKSIKDQLQFDAFWDFAYMRDLKALKGDNQGSAIQSVGGGFQYALDRYFSLRADYGWQLRKPPGAKSRSSQVDISVSLNN